MVALLVAVTAACGTAAPVAPTSGVSPTVPAVPSPTVPAGLSAGEASALNSLKLVDEFPLYTMEYRPGPGAHMEGGIPAAAVAAWQAWACSLFAALGDPKNRLYGRNFDWDFSPALLLSYDPGDGYASVSMIDIDYLGYSGASAQGLDRAPIEERRRLLYAPQLPFDGMNEKGLVVAMAAVPSANQPAADPAKATIGEIAIIREMLDHAANVDEAIALFRSYNIDPGGGPPIHYLLADRSGKAALLEFSKGDLAVIGNENAWHLATNFIRAEAGTDPESQCWRYKQLSAKLTQEKGRLSPQAALELLSGVSQSSTQWSAVYGMSTGDVLVTVGRDYGRVHTFHLDLKR